MKLAFYIASKGDLIDKLIAWWTKSKFSHVELIDDEGYWISTSPRLQCVTRRKVNPSEGKWIYVDVEADPVTVREVFDRTKGAKYDWTGILFSQIFEMNEHSEKRWICSEVCSEMLGYPDSNKYSPGDLYKAVTKTV